MVNLTRIKLKFFPGKSRNLKKSVNFLFWLLLLILIFFEVLVVKNSVALIIQSYQEPVVVNKNRGVRINFTDYDAVVQRIENAKNFQSQEDIIANPFGSK